MIGLPMVHRDKGDFLIAESPEQIRGNCLLNDLIDIKLQVSIIPIFLLTGLRIYTQGSHTSSNPFFKDFSRSKLRFSRIIICGKKCFWR